MYFVPPELSLIVDSQTAIGLRKNEPLLGLIREHGDWGAGSREKKKKLERSREIEPCNGAGSRKMAKIIR